MKVLSLTIALIMSLASMAVTLEGEFQKKKEIYFFNYITAADCQADGGYWTVDSEDEEIGFCNFEASDNVKIQKNAEGYFLYVDTIGTNGHSCFFEEKVTSVSENEVVSVTETEAYDYETGTFKPSTCSVKVSYKDENTVDVTTEGSCEEYCGARAWLFIEDAKRK